MANHGTPPIPSPPPATETINLSPGEDLAAVFVRMRPRAVGRTTRHWGTPGGAEPELPVAPTPDLARLPAHPAGRLAPLAPAPSPPRPAALRAAPRRSHVAQPWPVRLRGSGLRACFPASSGAVSGSRRLLGCSPGGPVAPGSLPPGIPPAGDAASLLREQTEPVLLCPPEPLNRAVSPLPARGQ